MEKIHLILAAALAVLAVGCNKEQASEAVSDGEEVSVTFTAGLPEVQTRAISDGMTAKNLFVAAYNDASGNPADHIPALDKTATFSNLKTSVTFNLVKGKTYHFIFWAQADNAPYTFETEDKTVTIDYAGAANDEKRDAFYAVKTITVQGAATEPVKLYRPFSQVNFGTADYTAAVASGVSIDKSIFTATDAAKTFDVFAGEGKDAADLSYTEAELPAEDLLLADGRTYKYMAMNYFLPVGKLSERHVSNVKAQFISTDHTVEISSPSAPVQSNWRTNIIGNLLTDQVVFNVEIVPAFDGDINVVQNVESLSTLCANGGSAVLTDNLVLDQTL